MLEWRFNNQQSKNELLIINFKAIGLLEVQNSSNIVSILVSRLKKQHMDQGRMVMVRSIIIPRISKRWSNPHNILDIKDSNTLRQNTTLAGEQVVFIMLTSSQWKEVKGGVDGNKNHQGQGGYFSSWAQLTSQKKSKCWRWSDTFAGRFQEDAIKQQRQQAREWRSGKL